MSELLIKKLTAEDFNAEKYVQELSQNSVGDLNLHEHRQKIQQLAEDTNTQLKKNVYINYMQFIETAKEISYLESEMYQLSHLITEQKSLLTSLLEISISGERGPGSAAQEIIEIDPEEIRLKQEQENRKKLTALVEKIEGCSHVMEVPDRFLLFDSDLVELDQCDYSALQRIHAYLLNDSLMVATWLSDRRGPIRYKFEKLYPLDQVLPVNIKDRGSTKNAFKVLVFPDPRVFQAPSMKAKQDWLDEIERAKNNKLVSDKRKAEQAQEMHQRERQASISKEDSLDSNNPFAEDDDSGSNHFLPDIGPPSLGPPEWVEELPEELDQAIAQRNFEDAVDLIDKGRDFFSNSPQTPELAEMRRSLESRVKTLVEVLQGELRVTPDKSLQGGPRAVRRATTLLVHLNRSSQACDLFLKHRTALLKASLKRLRLEGKTVLYVRQLCSIFFHSLLTTGREFVKAFPKSKSCTSAFVVWAQEEINLFAQIFSRHVFTTQTSITTVAECINCADKHCQQLSDIGLELSFMLHSLLLKDVEKWIKDGRDKMVEAVKLRAQEDGWKTLTYESKENFNKFLADMNDLGVPNVKSFVTSDKSISLTNNMIQFTRAFLCYLEDVLRLFWSETESLINESVTLIFSSQLRHCRNSLDDPLFASQMSTIRRNSGFLLDVVLSVGEHRYAEVTGHAHPTLHTFHALRPSLMSDVSDPSSGGEKDDTSSTNSTVNKYESNFL
ncbi:Exocyst complex component 8, partial [Armadillidium nasatum]